MAKREQYQVIPQIRTIGKQSYYLVSWTPTKREAEVELARLKKRGAVKGKGYLLRASGGWGIYERVR